MSSLRTSAWLITLMQLGCAAGEAITAAAPTSEAPPQAARVTAASTGDQAAPKPKPAPPLPASSAPANNPAPEPAPPLPTSSAPTNSPWDALVDSTPVGRPPPASSAPASTKAPDPAAEPEPVHQIQVKLGQRSCTLAWQASTFAEEDSFWMIGDIGRIETVDSPGCKKQLLWEPNPSGPQGPGGSESLWGGSLAKPGRQLEPGDAPGGSLADYNFDGYSDLCVSALSGAYNYSQLCWLFQPASRTFVRAPALDGLIWAKPKPQRRVITQYYRRGGSYYRFQELAWQYGQLVVLERVDLAGEIPNAPPDAPPLPEDQLWVEIYQRKGGSLVKVEEGLKPAEPTRAELFKRL